MNKVILTGYLAQNPERKSTLQGVAVTSFTVAVQRRFKNQSGGYDADFINCVAWRQTAEFVAKYFKKGSRIGVIGTLQVRSYTDNSNNKRIATEVIADEVEFEGGKKEGVQKEQQGYEVFGDEVNDAKLPF